MEGRQEWTFVLAVKQGIGDHGRPLQAPERPADDDGRTILMTQKPGRRWEARSQDKRPSMAVRGPLAGSADARGGRPSILGAGRRAIAVGRPLSANRGPGCPRGRPNPRNEGSGRPSGACGGGPKNGPADADLSVRVVASAEGERVEELCGREGLIRRNPPSVPPFSKGGGGLLAGASGWPPELLLDFGEDLLGQERRLRPVAALREPVDGLRRAGLQRVGGEAQALLGAVTGPFFGTAWIKTRSAVLTVSESGK